MDENVQTVSEVEAGGPDMRSYRTVEMGEWRQKENLIAELTRQRDMMNGQVKRLFAGLDELAGMISDDDFGGEYEALADWLVERFDLEVNREYEVSLNVTYRVTENITIQLTAKDEADVEGMVSDMDDRVMDRVGEEINYADSWDDPEFETVEVESIQ